MKKTILVLLLCLFAAGCVSVSYNPETKEVKYTRFGDQKLGGVLVELPDGTGIIIESQQSDARILSDALRILEKGISIGAGMP